MIINIYYINTQKRTQPEYFICLLNGVYFFTTCNLHVTNLRSSVRLELLYFDFRQIKF
jgi:hypothetical protein